MSEAKTAKMMIRVQSPEGTQRIELSDRDVTSRLFERVYETFQLQSFGFILHKDKQHKEEIISSKTRQLRDYGLKHGDMIYLSAVNGTVLFDQPTTSGELTNKPVSEQIVGDDTSIVASASTSSAAPKEDDVDLVLYKSDGNIQRHRDDKLCRHALNGCCVHCSPLEPWDEGYLRDHNIKHMSFHAYLKKLTSGMGRGKFVSLDELSCRIKPGCRDHPPWPRGICSTCQPNAVTLNRQPYRHVDNVMFENTQVVERFLAYWRATGHQRVGFLYGRYETHTDVPLGIRVRVSAIYEPPQSGGRDSVSLHEDDREQLVEELAEKLGLRRVGWIFTDLLTEDVSSGTVQHIRGVDTHFLSAQECIMAGHFQNQHPNVCHYASSGYFGSKFVTVCVTGDCTNQVHMEGYQVSGQCMALVRDGCLIPTKDAPELGYIRESTDKQYVPDVYYKERDQYGNEVQVVARRLPVAYLLVDVPAGVASVTASPAQLVAPSFPPANRPLAAHLQTLRALHQHITNNDNFLEAMSDLHVLLYLCTNEALSLSVSALGGLLDAVNNRDALAAEKWRAETTGFATLEQLAVAADEDHNHHRQRPQHDSHSHLDTDDSDPMRSNLSEWTCPHCTYHNAPTMEVCEICALPRNGGGGGGGNA